MQNRLEILRPFRPHLVGAAEKVFVGYNPKELKSQLNHLIAVCNEATCHEEIALYLRYQAAREGKHMDPHLVTRMIAEAENVFNDPIFAGDDALKVAAWRLYAVYLARTYTYKRAQLADTRPKPAHTTTSKTPAQKGQ